MSGLRKRRRNRNSAGAIRDSLTQGKTITMKRTIAVLAAMTLGVMLSAVHADYSVSDRGEWPDTWPKELEPLRKHAQTYEGPLVLYRHYLIPFTKREEFEAAWPHLLKVKTKGAPIILVRGP